MLGHANGKTALGTERMTEAAVSADAAYAGKESMW